MLFLSLSFCTTHAAMNKIVSTIAPLPILRNTIFRSTLPAMAGRLETIQSKQAKDLLVLAHQAPKNEPLFYEFLYKSYVLHKSPLLVAHSDYEKLSEQLKTADSLLKSILAHPAFPALNEKEKSYYKCLVEFNCIHFKNITAALLAIKAHPNFNEEQKIQTEEKKAKAADTTADALWAVGLAQLMNTFFFPH